MSTKIQVYGVAKGVQVDQLKALFEKDGPVVSIEATPLNTDPPSQTILIVMQNSEDAQHALTRLNGKDFEGRKLSMRQAPLGGRS